MKDYSFKRLKLTEAERLWLKEVIDNDPFDPRIAKVKLREKLPKGFKPTNIDSRLLNGKNITLVGLWYIHPNHDTFTYIDKVIRAIKEKILSHPGITKITSDEIAESTKLDKQIVEVTFYNLGTIGNFFSGATSGSESKGHSSLELSGDNSYDAYLDYEGIDELLEKYYVESGERLYSNIIWGSVASVPGQVETKETKVLKVKKPNTAFVLMAMDRNKPELEDVYQTIKDVCKRFGISAYRADEIEHQDRITDLILSEIASCEFLIADLSYERPNVYYEVGYAHAIGKRPILYRRQGTRLHFDLSVHNVPEYRNVTELRSLLTKRFEAILGRAVNDKT